MFVAVEGIKGTGKSTLVAELKKIITITAAREPFSTGLRALFASDAWPEDKQTQINLFKEDREAHLRAVIEPALSRGRLVVCDRYSASTAVYQSDSHVDAEKILCQLDKTLRVPDLYIILCVDVREAARRIAARGRGDAEPSIAELATRQARFMHLRGNGIFSSILLDANKSPRRLARQAARAIEKLKKQRQGKR